MLKMLGNQVNRDDLGTGAGFNIFHVNLWSLRKSSGELEGFLNVIRSKYE